MNVPISRHPIRAMSDFEPRITSDDEGVAYVTHPFWTLIAAVGTLLTNSGDPLQVVLGRDSREVLQ